MKLRLALALLFAASPCAAQLVPGGALKPPFPRATQTNKPDQQISTAPEKNRKSEQPSTTEAPTIVKAFTPQQDTTESHQQEQDRLNKAFADWWSLIFTGALVAVGFFQLLALIGQAVVFWIQARALRESVDLTRDIAKRQESDMRASIAEAARAAAAAQKSADVAERSLVALNRPYIFFAIAGSPVEHRVQAPGQQRDPSDVDNIIRLQFTLSYGYNNQGKTAALIHNLWLTLDILSDIPNSPIQKYMESRERSIASPKVATSIFGQGQNALVATAEFDIVDDNERIVRIMNGEEIYYAYGFIRYSDVFVRKTYLTGQAFRYDIKHRAFVVVGGEEYNYDRTLDDESSQQT